MATKNPIEELKKAYDEALHSILLRLTDLLNTLLKERADMELRIKTDLQRIFEAKKLEVLAKKEEFIQEWEKQKSTLTAQQIDSIKKKADRVTELEKEFGALLEEDINLGNNEVTNLKKEEASLFADMGIISTLITQIRNKVGAKKKYQFMVFGKGRNSVLLTPQELRQIYDQIKLVYQSLAKRGQEERIIKERIEVMKKRIEERANQILVQMDVTITGLTPSA